MRKIATTDLKPGMKVGRAVYSADGYKLLAADVFLNEKTIKRLKKLGIPGVYIDDGLLSDIEIDDIIREEVRVEAVKLVKDIFSPDNKKSPKMVVNDQKVAATVENIVDEIIRNKDAIVNMVDIRAFDDYTFAHSVNVCVLAILTGVSLGYSKSKLMLLGMGALLHDVGKTRVPIEVLNKPGKLTESEFKKIKLHSEYGYEILRKQPGLSVVVAEVAYQHHERYLGQGYPQGLKNDEIHEFAKITGIVDVFDALTADRVYRKAYPIHEAYEMLSSQGNSQFDFKILKTFLQNIAIYPIGTFVRLSTSEIASVVKVNKGLAMHPVVRVYFDEGGVFLKDPYEIDLSEVHNITIKDVLKEEELQQYLIKNDKMYIENI